MRLTSIATMAAGRSQDYCSAAMSVIAGMRQRHLEQVRRRRAGRVSRLRSVELGRLIVHQSVGESVYPYSAVDPGDGPLQITGGGCLAYLGVRNAAGELVGGDSRICTAQFVVWPLAPGAEHVEHPIWDGRVQGGALAPAGTYTVRRGVTTSGNRHVWSAPLSVIVEAP